MTAVLSQHQLTTIRMVATSSARAVARERGVTEQSVQNTLGIVRDKLGVKTTREAIRVLEQRGWAA